MAIPPQFKKKSNGKADPKKLEACVLKLKQQGKAKPEAFAICNARNKKPSK